MPRIPRVEDDVLKKIRKDIEDIEKRSARAHEISAVIKNTMQIDLHESTIRGRFIEMGIPLRGGQEPPPTLNDVFKDPVIEKPAEKSERKSPSKRQYNVPDEMKKYIPLKEMFVNYIERPVDKRLALHYNLGKYPLTQGKQGTGKTFSHAYYAFQEQLPFFLFSCHEEFRLMHLYGDKTIEGGNVKFIEGSFVKASQSPSVILFDEINAVGNEGTWDFHALLQNKELFVKDADNGRGRTYVLHPDCKIGFAQNPRSVKYIGGSIKPSNFLGRCTFLTYPEFTKREIMSAIKKKFAKMSKDDVISFTKFYFACLENIDKNDIPVDISIRQLNNVIDLWLNGMDLKEAIEDGMMSILDAISQSASKESFFRLAQGVWESLITNGQQPVKTEEEEVQFSMMDLLLR